MVITLDALKHSAIASGCVDFVLPPHEIARALTRIGRHPYAGTRARARETDDKFNLARLIQVLHQATGVDCTGYKFNTRYRRVTRRMVFEKMKTLPEYLQYLRQTAAEVEALYQDILISVTRFFRDKESFEALKCPLFPRLLNDRSRHEPMRLWTFGWSTGQDAYSLAIAFTEAAEAAGSSTSLQLFASDLNASGSRTPVPASIRVRGPAGGEHTTFWRAAPGRIPTQTAFSQSKRFETLDLDRAHGCIRDGAHAYSPEGGLAVLRGNLSPDGCVVKTSAVHAEMLRFSGTAMVFDSEVDAVAAMNDGRVKPGHVVTIRFEGPKGGPGMQELAKVPMGLKARGLDRVVAVITDGRYSGSNSELSVGHMSPEAASGGNIALVRDGDIIDIDPPGRTISLRLSEQEPVWRRATEQARGRDAWTPPPRPRKVSRALQAYALLATSADRGAVRDLSLERPASPS